MEPMKPMEPMKGIEPWWPAELGDPSSSGSQDGMRYAFFADKRRLLIEENGTRSTYDSGDLRITGRVAVGTWRSAGLRRPAGHGGSLPA